MCRRKKKAEESAERKSGGQVSERKSSGGFLGFLAFLVTIFAAVMYLVVLILVWIDVQVPKVIETMRSVASMITISIVGLLGWKFVRNRSAWCRVLYVLLVLTVVVCVVVPIVLQFVR